MRQTESLHIAIGPNANVLSDRKSLYTYGRRRVAHAGERENDTGPLIAYIIRIRRSHSDYAQVKC